MGLWDHSRRILLYIIKSAHSVSRILIYACLYVVYIYTCVRKCVLVLPSKLLSFKILCCSQYLFRFNCIYALSFPFLLILIRKPKVFWCFRRSVFNLNGLSSHEYDQPYVSMDIYIHCIWHHIMITTWIIIINKKKQ